MTVKKSWEVYQVPGALAGNKQLIGTNQSLNENHTIS